MNEGNAEMRALFKLLENNNKIDIKHINQLSKQLDELVKNDPINIDNSQAKNDSQPRAGIDNDDACEIKSFPNKKTQISYEEFCGIFDESVQSTLDNDEMLMKCFKIFDIEKLECITAENLRQVMEVFSFKTNIQDIRNVLRQNGLNEDSISHQDFKKFFKKIVEED